jgi:hypothetical protein
VIEPKVVERDEALECCPKAAAEASKNSPMDLMEFLLLSA